jgi:transcriptional regulator with XRE-family HTH domain
MTKSIHTSEYAALCEELRAARRNAGLSQRALAERLKVSPSWVAKVETGERRIDLVEFGWFVGACGGDGEAAFARITRGGRKGGKS